MTRARANRGAAVARTILRVKEGFGGTADCAEESPELSKAARSPDTPPTAAMIAWAARTTRGSLMKRSMARREMRQTPVTTTQLEATSRIHPDIRAHHSR